MNRTFSRIAVLTAAGLAATVVAASAVSAQGRPPHGPQTTVANTPGFRASGHLIQRFTAANMAGAFTGTAADAVNLARAYDVISATPFQFAKYLPAMRAANPHLIILVYMDATFAYRGQGNTYPDSWYLRDAAGNKLVVKGWGLYPMDPTNPGWIANQVQTCKSLVAGGYDGCMLDMLGPEATSAGLYTNGQPIISPATHHPYTAADWMAASARLAAAISSGISPKLVMGNGIGSGVVYFSPTASSRVLFGGVQNGIAESWMRSAGSPVTTYPSLQVWKDAVDALANASSHGWSMSVITKTWSGGSPAQIEAWHEFSLASFLLGTGGNDYYEFSSANTQAGIMYDSPLEHLNIGTPTGPYSQAGSVFVRQFTQGMILANPSTAAATVTLPQPYCMRSGRKVNSMTVGAHGAAFMHSC